MRVCLVGGPQSIHVSRFAEWLVERGHDVHVLFPSSFLRTNHTRIAGVAMHPVYTTPIFFKSSHLLLQPVDHFRFKRLVSDIRPDVLHAHYVRDYGFRAAATGFHPLVVSVWGSDVLVDPRRSPVVRWEVAHTLKRADLITCSARHMLSAIQNLAGIEADIRTVGFGVDTRLFTPATPDAALKERLGLSGRRVVVSTRGLRPIYDVATLIRSASLVLKDVPDAAFLIIGGGPLGDSLRDLAESLGVGDAVRFTGPVPNDDLPRYLSISEVYVSTSLSDASLSASTAEAMACGLPVVISHFGDNPDWVREGEGGYLFPCSDHETLADRLIRVLGDGYLRAAAAESNRRTVLERCDRDNEMGKMEGHYVELISRRGNL